MADRAKSHDRVCTTVQLTSLSPYDSGCGSNVAGASCSVSSSLSFAFPVTLCKLS